MEPLFPQLGFLPGERELRVPGGAALELLGELDPVQGIMRGMAASGRAADSDLSPEERRSSAIEAATETALAALPMGIGSLTRAAGGTSRRVIDDIVESLTAVNPSDAVEAARFYGRFGEGEMPSTEGFYVPTPAERAQMAEDATPAQANFLLREQEALALKAEGVSNEEILGETGISFLPIRGADGELIEEIPALATGRPTVNQDRLEELAELAREGKSAEANLSDILQPTEEYLALRPQAAEARIVLDPELRSIGGYDRNTGDLVVNPTRVSRLGGSVAGALEDVIRHENVHSVLRPSERGDLIGGRNPLDESEVTQLFLRDARTTLDDAQARLDAGEIGQDQYDETVSRIGAAREGMLRTPFERYNESVGEVLARAPMQNNPEFQQSYARLTPSEVLNPVIRPDVSAPRRYMQAGLTSLLPYERLARLDAFQNRVFPSEYGDLPYFSRRGGFDYYARVPSDITRAQQTSSTVTPDEILTQVAARPPRAMAKGGLVSMANEVL